MTQCYQGYFSQINSQYYTTVMSTEYTVDDSSSFQCFCGFKHCCCRWLNIKLKGDINIMEQLKLEEQRQMLRDLELRETIEKRRNRKAIFTKKQSLVTLEKSDKNLSAIGSSQNIPVLPMFETKRTIRRNPFSPTKTNRIFKNSEDLCNNTTILFDPAPADRHETIDFNGLNASEENVVKGFVGADETKLMLEEFLESELFGSVNESQVDRTVPSLIQRFGHLVSVSVNIHQISLKKVEQEKVKLFQCIEEGKKLGESLLAATEEIQRYLDEKEELVNNFNVVNFIRGEWLPNWQRLDILLPKTQFTPQPQSPKECSDKILANQSLINRINQQLINTFLTPQLYISARSTLFQTFLLFNSICESLYITVRNNRMDSTYQTAYRIYNQKLQITPSDKLSIKNLLKQRELYQVKLRYLKDTHDLIWTRDVGELLMEKVAQDIKQLKREYYRKP